MKRGLISIGFVVVVAGCGAKAAEATGPRAPAPAPAPVSTAGLTAGIQPDAFLLGDWVSADGKQHMHWLAAAGALYGVRFPAAGGFECTMIDDTGDARALQRWTYADGKSAGPLPATDEPRKTGDATMTSGGVEWHRGAGMSAPALEAADQAFFAATRDRGPDGWADWFAPDGVNWGGGQIVTGRDAIKADIAGLLGKARLEWTPVASRWGATPDLGFTVGTFSVVKENKVVGKGSYVTVWKQQPDQSWKVIADAGRPAND